MLVFTIVFLTRLHGRSQSHIQPGARFYAMGNAGVASPDVFSVFANPSSMTYLPGTTIGSYYDHRYAVQGISTSAVALVHTFKELHMGGGATRYGDDLLNESSLRICLAHKIRQTSMGGAISYQQLAVAESGTWGNVLVQLGGNVQITPLLAYGAQVSNFLRAKITKEASFYYPVVMSTGLSYTPIKQALVTAEVEKVDVQKANCKVGLEYNWLGLIAFRMGVNTSPSAFFYGVGWKWRNWALDYGGSYHSRLGAVHAVGLLYRLSPKKASTALEVQTP